MIISIKDLGLIFNFKGKEYRTPLKLQISDRDINEIMFSLKKSGISKFKILNGIDSEPKKIEHSKEKIVKENLTMELLLEKINKRFDYLEILIKQFNNKTNNKIDDDIQIIKDNIKRRNKEQNIEEFIPTPSLDFETKILNVIDSSKMDMQKMNEAIVGYDKAKLKRGGFTK